MASAYPDTPPPRPLRTALIVALLAFLVGLAVMAWALTRWTPAKRLIAGGRASGVAEQPLQVLTQAPPAQIGTPQPLAPASLGQAQAIDVRVADLEARIARIDLRAAAAAGNAARAESLLVAFAARRAIDRGAALGYIEAQLRERFGEAQPRAVAAIVAAAQAPVTLDSLRQGLDVAAPALSGGSAPTETMWDATKRNLSGLFVVRRAGAISAAPDERIARARLMIEGGQVDRALAEVSRLPGRAGAGEWTAAARRWIEAHRALDLIETAALTAPGPAAKGVE